MTGALNDRDRDVTRRDVIADAIVVVAGFAFSFFSRYAIAATYARNLASLEPPEVAAAIDHLTTR